jgi:preprotein translocase subunit SecF
MKTLRLVPDGTHINFVGMRFVAFVLSVILFIGSITLLFTKGLNFGIDFTGGTIIEVRLDEAPDLADLRGKLTNLNIGAVSIQEFGSDREILVRIPEQSGGLETQQAAVEGVRNMFNEIHGEEAVEYRRTEFVGPQVGEELIEAGLYAVIFSMLGILLYVTFRFEWQFGVASVIALIHDAIITIGFFALTGLEFNLATVAAVLMIAGYSINDTVVVFDRVRENMRKYKKLALTELLNTSVNQMLARTLLTSITTLLALVALYVFGGEVLRGFISALIFGIIVGTYSSTFVAGALLTYLNVRRSTVED